MIATDTDYAYIAGVIDSDGCIQACKLTSGSGHYRAELHVIQKNIAIIDFLYSRFEGSVNVVNRQHKSGLKNYIRWMITGTRMANILKNCLPYLVLKKEQAKLAIELQSMLVPKGRARKLPVEAIERRKYIAFKMKSLNSPATTECASSRTREMRQSELTQMKNRQSAIRRDAPLN